LKSSRCWYPSSLKMVFRLFISFFKFVVFFSTFGFRFSPSRSLFWELHVQKWFSAWKFLLSILYFQFFSLSRSDLIIVNIARIKVFESNFQYSELTPSIAWKREVNMLIVWEIESLAIILRFNLWTIHPTRIYNRLTSCSKSKLLCKLFVF
jgi:hypothetical protein